MITKNNILCVFKLFVMSAVHLRQPCLQPHVTLYGHPDHDIENEHEHDDAEKDAQVQRTDGRLIEIADNWAK